jgi:transcriptional regulator with XRE-family HTH domain
MRAQEMANSGWGGESPSPEDLRYILGLKLKALRLERGLSLSELAARAGMSTSYLSEIEGGRKYPKPDKLVRLAVEVGVPYDELVSLRVPEELGALKSVFSSEFVREFPFELFGVEPEDLFAMVTDDPVEAGGLFQTFLEIGRTHGVQVEQLLFAALRSYQQLRHNYFQEMEESAAAFREAEGWPSGEPIAAPKLRSLLEDRYGCLVDEEQLATHPDLREFRSVYLPVDPPRLLVNGRLLPSQKAFIYGREIGYRHLGLKERAITGSWLDIQSFAQILNNFKASYFSGALLIDEGSLVEDLGSLFADQRWDGDALLESMQRFDATPEMFFYRMSQIVPERFGIDQIFFLRFHHTTGSDDVRLTKALNISHVPVPHGIGLDEHYCRRWPEMRLLRELAERQRIGPVSEPLIAVQRSRFLNEDATFFVVAVARPLALSAGINSCVSLGFLLDDAFRSKVHFWNDTSVPDVLVNLTCERCGLTPAECQERSAPPILYGREQERARQREALEELVAEARGR